MRLPNISRILSHTPFTKKPVIQKPYLSLVFDTDAVAGATWFLTNKGNADLTHAVARRLDEHTWEKRIEAADTVISVLEEKFHGNSAFSDVIFGLPPEFIAQNGDIEPDIKKHLKKASDELSLHPIGFVSVHQAVVFRLKKLTGVPPSAILVHLHADSITVLLYKTGIMLGFESVPISNGEPSDIERALLSIASDEPLPAKIVVYATDQFDSKTLKTSLAQYPWKQKLRFIHIPRVEILEPDFVVTAVSSAGAGELSMSDSTYRPVEEKVFEQDEEEEDYEADEMNDDESVGEKEVNVSFVDPDELGFKKNIDILETPDTPVPKPEKIGKKVHFVVPKIRHLMSVFRGYSGKKEGKPFTKYIFGALILFCAAVLVFVLASFLPEATVTMKTETRHISKDVDIVIDSTVAAVNVEDSIIPGRKVENEVEGSDSIDTTGTKEIGDPAQGSVTIYNKTTTERTFKKGTELIAGSLTFLLDSEVRVASASESIGSITFGKSEGSVTAEKIGSNGNMPQGTDFVFAGLSQNSVSARNDEALKGGTSKEINVVSRADYDTLTEKITEKIEKDAVNQLISSGSGSFRIIDGTVKTAVSRKNFEQEIDEESKTLQGAVAVKVSGIGYEMKDVSSLLEGLIAKELPDTYTLDSDSLDVTLSDVSIQKDGTIQAKASVSGTAEMNVDENEIKTTLAGKTVEDAQTLLDARDGVASVEIILSRSWFTKRLPSSGRISVHILSE